METLTTYPFADHALARRLESAEGRANAALVETRARLQRESGATYTEIAGVYAMFDGATSPLTQTFGLGMSAAVGDAALDAIEAFFRERGAATCHEVSPLADAGLLRLLHGRGYEPIEVSTVLYQPIDNADDAFQAPPGVVPLTSPGASAFVTPTRVPARRAAVDEADLWAEVSAAGWAGESAELAAIVCDLARVIANCPCFYCFIAELDGWPIAAGAVAMDDGVALLAGSSTVPWRRRCGAQAALLEARLQFAASGGCDTAMMVAAPGSASQRNAERQGFRVAYTRTKWRLAGTGRASS